MSDKSAIQWTDATWNPTTGCTKVSPGCANCYIERTPAFRIAGRKFVKGATDLRLHEDRLPQPLHWKKPRRVFVNSLSDLFHQDVPDAFIDRVFAVMALTPQHQYQILTKRADRMRTYIKDENDLPRIGIRISRAVSALTQKAVEPRGSRAATDWNAHADHVAEWTWRKEDPFVIPNVALGVSIENQRWLERADVLKDIPAAVHFLSLEPLLEDLGALILDGIEWVIVGGESGPGARPCHLEWIRSVINECRRQNIPCFVKQIGTKPIGPWGSVASGRVKPWSMLHDKKGGDPSEWPADLRVREFPEVRV